MNSKVADPYCGPHGTGAPPVPVDRNKGNTMSWLVRRRIAPLLVLAVATWGSGVPVAHAAQEAAVPAYDLSFLLDTVPGGVLADQAGHRRAAADFAGKLVVVGLVTTRCPSLCVIRSLAMAAVAKGLPEDVRERLRYVAISVDPADRPADLVAFSAGLHLDPARWTLLATDAGQADRIRDAIGRQVRRPGESEAEPATNLFLFDGQGRLMQSFGKPRRSSVQLASTRPSPPWSETRPSKNAMSSPRP